MKWSVLSLFILAFFTSPAFALENVPCDELMDQGKQAIAMIKKNISEKKDIDDIFDELEGAIKLRPDCLSYQKLKLSDNDIAGFRKHIFAYDRSFNLEKENCSEYSVDTSNMPKNNNQNSLSWCFAFAAADMMSFHEKKRLSAYDLALTNHISREDIDRTKISNFADLGGWPVATILHSLLNGKGICLEDEVNFTQGDWAKLSDMMKKLTSPDKKLTEIICENQFNERETFKDVAQNVFKALDKLSAEKRAAALLDIQCKNRHSIKQKYKINEMNYGRPHTREKMVEKADEVLARGEPVMINYAAGLLSGGVNFQGNFDHVSTLIKRKFNPESGQCEYLIKNSWGSSDCQITKSIRCEDGNYWVPRTALKNNLFQISTMDKHP